MDAERFWVVKVSLLIVGITFTFFVVAPGLLNFPLEYDQAIRIMQIIFPVFLGYLGLATTFLFSPMENESTELPINYKLLKLLLRGPVYILTIGLVTVTTTFWITNRADGEPASGMTVDQLSLFISVLLALLSATTGLIVSKLFPSKTKDSAQKENGVIDEN